MTYTFFNQKVDDGLNEVYSEFDTIQWIVLKLYHKIHVFNLSKISHLTDLGYDYFSLEFGRIIMEYPIFNVNLRRI